MAGCRAALDAAGFDSVTVEVDSEQEAGVISGTSPPRGGRGVPGQLVTILVSNGSDYVPPPPTPTPDDVDPDPPDDAGAADPGPETDPPPDTDPDSAPDPDLDPVLPGG